MIVTTRSVSCLFCFYMKRENVLVVHAVKYVWQLFLKTIHINTLSTCKLDPSAEAAPQRCSIKKVFLQNSQNSQENTCARASFLIKLQARGSCEFCEIFKNIFFTDYLRTTASKSAHLI